MDLLHKNKLKILTYYGKNKKKKYDNKITNYFANS